MTVLLKYIHHLLKNVYKCIKIANNLLHIKFPIMLPLCFNFIDHYAQTYAGIIGGSLITSTCVS